MGTITTSPTSGAYDAGDNAVGTTVQSDIQTIVNEFNGSIEAINLADNAVETAKINNLAVTTGKIASAAVVSAKVGWTQALSGVQAWQFAPNWVGANGGIIARVRKDVTWGGGTSDSVTFTYSSDCIDGDPGFSATPCLSGKPFVADTITATTALITTARVTATSATAITMTIEHGANSETVTVEFIVAGPA